MRHRVQQAHGVKVVSARRLHHVDFVAGDEPSEGAVDVCSQFVVFQSHICAQQLVADRTLAFLVDLIVGEVVVAGSVSEELAEKQSRRELLLQQMNEEQE